MKWIHRLAAVLGLASAAAHAQIATYDLGTVDGTHSRNAMLTVSADAHYTVRTLRVPFRKTGYEAYEGTTAAFMDAYFFGFLDRNNNKEKLGEYVFSNQQRRTEIRNNFAEYFQSGMIEAAIRAVVDFMHVIGDNNIANSYAFDAPIDGWYDISVLLKGDRYVVPRNRVKIWGANGMVWETDEEHSKDMTKVVRLWLPKGPYGARVAIGSGVSNMVHGAGHVEDVKFNNDRYVEFDVPHVVVASTEVSLPEAMPNVGDQASFPLVVAPGGNENMIDGNVVYSNLRADPSMLNFLRLNWAVSTQDQACEPGIYVTHYILFQASDAAPPIYADGIAQFFLRRDPDAHEDGVFMCDPNRNTLTPTEG